MSLLINELFLSVTCAAISRYLPIVGFTRSAVICCKICATFP